MTNKEISSKFEFPVDDMEVIQDATRADERKRVISEIEKEIHNLNPEFAIKQIQIWIMEQKSKLNSLKP